MTEHDSSEASRPYSSGKPTSSSSSILYPSPSTAPMPTRRVRGDLSASLPTIPSRSTSSSTSPSYSQSIASPVASSGRRLDTALDPHSRSSTTSNRPRNRPKKITATSSQNSKSSSQRSHLQRSRSHSHSSSSSGSSSPEPDRDGRDSPRRTPSSHSSSYNTSSYPQERRDQAVPNYKSSSSHFGSVKANKSYNIRPSRSGHQRTATNSSAGHSSPSHEVLSPTYPRSSVASTSHRFHVRTASEQTGSRSHDVDKRSLSPIGDRRSTNPTRLSVSPRHASNDIRYSPDADAQGRTSPSPLSDPGMISGSSNRGITREHRSDSSSSNSSSRGFRSALVASPVELEHKRQHLLVQLSSAIGSSDIPVSDSNSSSSNTGNSRSGGGAGSSTESGGSSRSNERRQLDEYKRDLELLAQDLEIEKKKFYKEKLEHERQHKELRELQRQVFEQKLRVEEQKLLNASEKTRMRDERFKLNKKWAQLLAREQEAEAVLKNHRSSLGSASESGKTMGSSTTTTPPTTTSSSTSSNMSSSTTEKTDISSSPESSGDQVPTKGRRKRKSRHVRQAPISVDLKNINLIPSPGPNDGSSDDSENETEKTRPTNLASPKLPVPHPALPLSFSPMGRTTPKGTLLLSRNPASVILKEGYLDRCVSENQWEKVYAVLRDGDAGSLFLHPTSEGIAKNTDDDSLAMISIPLTNIKYAVMGKDSEDRCLVVNVSLPENTTYQLMAASKEQCEQWYRSIQVARHTINNNSGITPTAGGSFNFPSTTTNPTPSQTHHHHSHSTPITPSGSLSKSSSTQLPPESHSPSDSPISTPPSSPPLLGDPELENHPIHFHHNGVGSGTLFPFPSASQLDADPLPDSSITSLSSDSEPKKPEAPSGKEDVASQGWIKDRLYKVWEIEENQTCCDCDCPKPTWASGNLGIFICTQCSGVHRSMGVHISAVLSVKLDAWSLAQLENAEKWGNKRANEKWEFCVPTEWHKPNRSEARTYREKYIRAKYEHGVFLSNGTNEPLPPQFLSEASLAASETGTPGRPQGMVEYNGMVTLRLLEAKDLHPGFIKLLSSYVSFTLGGQSVKSKVQKLTNQPKWEETLMLCWNETDLLEINLINKDQIGGRDERIGTHLLDISNLVTEEGKNTDIWIPLLKPKSTQTKTDVKAKQAKPDSDRLELLVEIDMARGLAENNGHSSDPFCSLRCGDEKMKTFVAARTSEPRWKQQFTFGLSQGLTGDEDLVVLVKDWDRFSSNDFLGAVAFPITNIVKMQRALETEAGEGSDIDLDSTGKWYKLKAFPGYKTRSGDVKGEVYIKMLTRKWNMGGSRATPTRSTSQFSDASPSPLPGLDGSNNGNTTDQGQPQLPVIGEEHLEMDEVSSSGLGSPTAPTPHSSKKKDPSLGEDTTHRVLGIRDALVERLQLKSSHQKPGRLFSPFFEPTKVKKDIGRLHLQLTYVAISH